MLRRALRQRIARFVDLALTDECDIWRREATFTLMTPDNEWRNISAAIPCRVIKAGQANTTGIELQNDAQVVAENELRVALPKGTDLLAGDQIELRGERWVGVRFDVSRIEENLTDSFFITAVIFEG